MAKENQIVVIVLFPHDNAGDEALDYPTIRVNVDFKVNIYTNWFNKLTLPCSKN